MKKVLKISLLTCLFLTNTYAQEKTDKDIDKVNSFSKMFSNGDISAQVKLITAGYNQKAKGVTDTYATAIGGKLKYELASYNGFSAGIEGVISQDIDPLTGDKEKQNIELSSDKSTYIQMSELYLNYKYKNFNVRAGKQTIDTPLVDSDDTRMISNTFEAYIANYEYNNFTFTFGNLQKFQGVDAGLGSDNEDEWLDIGTNGAWFGGINYSSIVDVNIWYYDISGDVEKVHATYIDLSKDYNINENISIHGGLQYLHEADLKGSEIEADIYGAMAELAIYNLGFNIAYNYSDGKSKKRSFSGLGGGTMYTSMDTMIIDEIADDRDAQAIITGVTYDVGDWNFLYAYGDFDGKQNSFGEDAHIVEQNIGFTYTFNNNLELAAIYVSQEDKKNTIKTENDWNRYQVTVKYDF